MGWLNDNFFNSNNDEVERLENELDNFQKEASWGSYRLMNQISDNIERANDYVNNSALGDYESLSKWLEENTIDNDIEGE